jgi:hypothetical protein
MPEQPLDDRLDDRLDDAAVEELVGRVEQLLGRLEEVPGPAGELAAAAVAALTELYGEALARVAGHARGSPALRELADDALVGRLLALHGLHPDPVDRRVARALDGLRLELSSLGRDVTLAGLADGVAEVVLSGHGGGCGSGGPSVAQLTDLVRDVVVGAAPELADVRVVPERPTTFVPLESLLRAPTAQAAGP